MFAEVDSPPLLQFLVIFGKKVLQIDAGSDPYARKYKGIWICFLILARALGGNYVMCGVFELYGDPSLKVRPPGPSHSDIWLICWWRLYAHV